MFLKTDREFIERVCGVYRIKPFYFEDRALLCRSRFQTDALSRKDWKIEKTLSIKRFPHYSATLYTTPSGRKVVVRRLSGKHGGVAEIFLKLFTMTLQRCPTEKPLAFIEHDNGIIEHVTEFDEEKMPVKELAPMQTVEENIAMFAKILKALRKGMHDKNHVHGDLHAGNILYDPKIGAVKFIDVEQLGAFGKEATGNYKELLEKAKLDDRPENHKFLDVSIVESLMRYYLRGRVHNPKELVRELIEKHYLHQGETRLKTKYFIINDVLFPGLFSKKRLITRSQHKLNP